VWVSSTQRIQNDPTDFPGLDQHREGKRPQNKGRNTMDTMRQGYTAPVSNATRSVVGHANRVLKGIILMLCAALMFSLALACTGDRSLRDYYGRCIDRKISLYEHNPDLLYFSGLNAATCSVQAIEKIRFYEENRDTLIALMEEQEIGDDPQKVEHFLLKAYADSMKTVTASARR
jgi:hypothetical protein